MEDYYIKAPNVNEGWVEFALPDGDAIVIDEQDSPNGQIIIPVEAKLNM